ncbi:ascorbate transporter, chloroplastic [Nephila pilipes]|uniref:Ascorbate transporter, chloroplastic n=1 Tax=Nephila pilipes TaxID=299642 RepID=A0A8X6N1T1_NEPPI|nr:ascorbate transporter, chloroplastic [Nephila pilipes]
MLAKTSKIIALCSLANFINAADRIVMPIAIIPMTDYYNWNLYWQGWILSAFAFGYITSQIVGASAASKFGGKTVMTFAVFLWSLSTVITPYIASSLSLLIICRILLGLGEGIGLPTVFNIFAHAVPVEERSRAFGYLVASGTAGQTIAALICPHLPWPWMFYVFGSLGIFWVLLWLMFYKDNPNSGVEELPLVFPKVTNVNVRWIEFVSHWSLWAIYIAHFAMNWSNYIIMQWLPTYLSRNLGADQKDVSLTAMPYLINSLCGVVSGHFADSLISRKWTVLSVRRLMTCIGLVGPGIFLLCFNAVNNLLAAVILVSISMGLCACNSAGHLSNHADVAPNHAGVTFAISNTIATIPGILCGPVTAELVTQSHGRWFPVFVLAGCVNFVGSVIYTSQSSASQAL